jgi:hypothetical protein
MSSAASMTNQRLDIARRFLAMPNTEQKWMGPAFENAALFHLQSALLGLLQEVKQAYHLSSEIGLQELYQDAKSKQISIPVINELFELTLSSESWYCQLQNAFDASLKCHPNFYNAKQENLIVSSSDTSSACLTYLNSLTEIILRFREESSEY